MRTRLVAVFVILAAVGGLLYLRHRRLARPSASEPGGAGNTGVDFRLSPMLAGFSAPDGGTPCETAYNALSATDDAARGTGMAVPWTRLPDRDTFLARCAALPPQEQECMQPRYAASHHPACDPILGKYEKDNPLWR
jgi:hypothetical protein